ncbi:recombinase family protein [Candidatus Parcubacteria bacterium]|nr:recombinase family protein [Candidatus Parcubacteria bacterium]
MSQYFLYARKSTDVEDRQVLSIEGQLAELRALAKREGLEIAAEYIEKRTAKMPGRPVFNEMLSRIQQGEAQGIICWKLDRLARNPVDGGQISWLLQQGTIRHIQTHDRSHVSNDNVLMMSVEFGMANQFIRDLSANTTRGLHHKARLGYFPGTAPIGYLNDVRAKTIVVDRKKSKHVRAAFELYAKGNSRLEDISKFLYDNGVRSWGGLALHKDRVRFILTNPFYYGQFRYGNEIYEGKHTPLITKELFDKVQRVIERRGHPQKPEKQPKVFCGLLRCGECGCMITAEIQKGHTYYRCTKKKLAARCSQPYVREETLTADLSEILAGYAMPTNWAQGLLALAAEDERDASRSTAVVVSGLQDKLADIRSKLDRLTTVFIDQDIDRDTYLARKRELMSERKSVEEVQAKSERGGSPWLEPMREWIKDASMLDEIAKNGDLPSKKSSLQKIFGSNLTLRNKKPVELPVKQYASLREARANFPETDLSFILAPGAGLEPATNALHQSSSFLKGWTISSSFLLS